MLDSKNLLKIELSTSQKKILDNNNYKEIIAKIKESENNSNDRLDFSNEEMQLLIEGNASHKILTQAIENIKNPQDIEFDINKLANNPEAGVIIKSLKEKGIFPKTKIDPNFYNLIYNRNYAFLDILLSNYPNYFSIKEYFGFLNQDLNLENNRPLKHKLAFIDWLDNKIQNQNISQEAKNNLTDIIKVNEYLLLEISMHQPQDFKKYLEIIVKYSQNDIDFLFDLLDRISQENPQTFLKTIELLTTKQGDNSPLTGDQLFILLNKENNNKATPLYYLAQKDPQTFLKTIEFLAKKQEDQSSASLTTKQLSELLNKKNGSPLRQFAYNKPSIFLENIKFLTTKQENQSPLITGEQLLQVLKETYVLDWIAKEKPTKLLETIENLSKIISIKSGGSHFLRAIFNVFYGKEYPKEYESEELKKNL